MLRFLDPEIVKMIDRSYIDSRFIWDAGQINIQMILEHEHIPMLTISELAGMQLNNCTPLTAKEATLAFLTAAGEE